MPRRDVLRGGAVPLGRSPGRAGPGRPWAGGAWPDPVPAGDRHRPPTGRRPGAGRRLLLDTDRPAARCRCRCAVRGASATGTGPGRAGRGRAGREGARPPCTPPSPRLPVGVRAASATGRLAPRRPTPEARRLCPPPVARSRQAGAPGGPAPTHGRWRTRHEPFADRWDRPRRRAEGGGPEDGGTASRRTGRTSHARRGPRRTGRSTGLLTGPARPTARRRTRRCAGPPGPRLRRRRAPGGPAR